jgi:regulator of protease activity HflC (stomatin/prohibitin superfamily)
MLYFNIFVWAIIVLKIVSRFLGSFRVVSTRTALIVERLGRYKATLGPGFHILVPFIDKVTATQDLKEETLDVPPQECFSKDEVQVEVDGVMYISVVDPVRATYGVTDYRFAATQLAQTTTRSVIGTLELDRTFEERDMISAQVVETLTEAGAAWGITVHRYEIKNIKPPASVQDAMEKQVTAERDRRAIFARSEGEKQGRINTSLGLRAEMINLSEGEMQKNINEAEGRASEILAVAGATAESIEKVGAAVSEEGGAQAVRLDVADKYISTLAHLANPGTDVIFPLDLSHFEKILGSLEQALGSEKG